MLLLTSTSDLIKLITSAATNVDVHASFLDFESATGVESVLPVRTDTLITTATTTTIVGSPADVTTYRNVKFLSIRNRDTAVSNTVTVEHFDGTTTVELIKVTLQPGSELFFFANTGWFVLDATGASQALSVNDPNNSSTATLGIGAAFTGTKTDVSAYATVQIGVFSDVASATNGLSVQFSSDGTNWDFTSVTTYAGGSIGITIPSGRREKWFRIVYTNGGTGQASFRLTTRLTPISVELTKRFLSQPATDAQLALLTNSVMSGKTLSGGKYVNIMADPQGSILTAPGGAGADAFGRGRVSQLQTLFDVSFEYDTQPLLMQTVNVGAGTATKTANISSVTLTTGGNTSGDGSIFQSKQYVRYEPGKSQLIQMTGVLGAAKANVRSQIGYYDANNGVFFDQNNGIAVTIRSHTSGSAVDTAVVQASWNIDKMDGTGTSGVTLDFTKGQVFVIDLQWLSEGRVRFGFNISGQIIYCHQVVNANILTVPYMNTANLPVRWEIHNTATASGATTMTAICGCAGSEGGNDLPAALSFTANNGATPISANARRPVLSIQLKTTFNSITNRSRVILKDIAIMCASNPGFYELVYNGTLTGASFASVDANSGVNVDIAATAIANGTVIDSGYCPAGSLSNRASVLKDLIQKLPITLDAAGTTADIVTVVISGITGAASTTAALTWTEER